MNASTGESYDNLFKIVLIGDSGVGKTNILSRFIMDVFQVDSKTTIGVEFSAKLVTRGDKTIKAQVWDTAGQERYRAITSTYYRGASGAFIVFDISHRETFDHLQQWIGELIQQTDTSIPVIIIGNKADLIDQRSVSKEEAKAFAEQHNMGYMETSALNATNINEAFDSLIDYVIERTQNQGEQYDDINQKQPIIQGNSIPIQIDNNSIDSVKSCKC